MNGARQLARDFIQPRLTRGDDVLDVCCGDCWLKPVVERAEAHWWGVDLQQPPSSIYGSAPRSHHTGPLDVTARGRFHAMNLLHIHRGFFPASQFDVIASVWGLQHLLGGEANVWNALRAAVKPHGSFLYVGRYADFPGRETGRQDPLNGYSLHALQGLALATGWELRTISLYQYEGDHYELRDNGPCNAFTAELGPI